MARPPAADPLPAPTPVAIALGSNLGDRVSHLAHAVSRLEALLTGLRVSRWHETDPVGVAGPQPPFLNGAVVGRTILSAPALLEALLAIERDAGRSRPHPGAARTLDLDLILYGDQVLDLPGLTVPHPRFRERAFVLAPLAEIAAEWVDPVTGRTVEELLRQLTVNGERGTGNGEQGTRNGEHGTGNRERGTVRKPRGRLPVGNRPRARRFL
jgi:2-amino-4-hydroxy-6-hydroxymethyldihydropteridine diphosphokinase